MNDTKKDGLQLLLEICGAVPSNQEAQDTQTEITEVPGVALEYSKEYQESTILLEDSQKSQSSPLDSSEVSVVYAQSNVEPTVPLEEPTKSQEVLSANQQQQKNLQVLQENQIDSSEEQSLTQTTIPQEISLDCSKETQEATSEYVEKTQEIASNNSEELSRLQEITSDCLEEQEKSPEVSLDYSEHVPPNIPKVEELSEASKITLPKSIPKPDLKSRADRVALIEEIISKGIILRGYRAPTTNNKFDFGYALDQSLKDDLKLEQPILEFESDSKKKEKTNIFKKLFKRR